jgi:hypothetical protein
MRGFRLAAIEKNDSDTAGSVRAAGAPSEQLASIGSALFLLASSRAKLARLL